MSEEIVHKDDLIIICTRDDNFFNKLSSLISNKYTLRHAQNYDNALELITFTIPQLIIAEDKLNTDCGKRLIKDIRSSIKTKLIPFIIVTDTESDTERIEYLNHGADACVQSPVNIDELSALITTNINRYNEFYKISITDELTRLYNRKEFIKNFQDHIDNNSDSVMTLTIFDIDLFKKVNDLYGHQIGDIVLMEFANILKNQISENFFPARFGGEEFVVLSPGLNANQTKIIIENILDEFSSKEFKAIDKTFYVSFSAGIAEYPSMSNNVSELLSRADQALYAAKNAGRKRVFIFSSIMSRNDRFWEYLKGNAGIFVDSAMNNAITGLPYLPSLLETISHLEFDVKSIGVLFLKLNPIFNIEDMFGYANKQYDIENITFLIKKICEFIFPSDTYIGHGDFHHDEYIILFPGVVDFSTNITKFHQVCKDICNSITFETKSYHIDLSYSDDVIFLGKYEPSRMYKDILKIKEDAKPITEKKKSFKKYSGYLNRIPEDYSIKQFLTIKSFYSLSNNEVIYNYIALKDPYIQPNILSALIQKNIKTKKKLSHFMRLINIEFSEGIDKTLLIPFIPSLSLKTHKELIEENFPNINYHLMINQKDLPEVFDSLLSSPLSSTISFGIDNCYIGNDILAYLSIFNFKVLLFSENIIQNLHYFKDRIKVISGLKIFLDQVNVAALAKNIQKEEEYQVIQDLNLRGASGKFMVDLKKGAIDKELYNL